MTRSAVVIGIALPGALAACWFGVMAAGFAGDASPTRGTHQAWFLWGILGGACIGALPAVFVGLAWRKWWVVPILGGALGAMPGLLEGFGVHVFRPIAGGRFINVAGYGSAACTLLGLVIGLVVWRVVEASQKGATDSLAEI